MKKILLSLLGLVIIVPVGPVVAQAAIGDNVKNAVNNSSTETQTTVLQARKKALTTALNVCITAVTKANAVFQANIQFTSEQKTQAQNLTTTTIAELNTQITAIAGATSNAELDIIRAAAVTELKSYEDDFKALLAQATTAAYTQMITSANQVLVGMKALVPVFKAAKQDTTAFQAQINLCDADITASDTAFYKALDTHASVDLKASAQATAKLGTDMTKLVQMADEMAE